MWQDELTSVNGTSLTYDANGNVLTYGNMEFEWTNGRTLSQITVNPEDENGTADVYSYTYDESGIRSSKTVNGVTTYFTTKDGVILSQTDGTNTMYFQYDSSGNPTGFLYNGTQYFYLTNQMGDVIGITDNTGSLIATYTYGAWGEVLAVTPATTGGSAQLAIANANPLRYRGYYYDQETGYYYLQSRYYDSALTRFINTDKYEITSIAANYAAGLDLFVYCNNNPVNTSDPTGSISLKIPRWIAIALFNVIASVIPGLKSVYYPLKIGIKQFAKKTSSYVLKNKIRSSLASAVSKVYCFAGRLASGLQKAAKIVPRIKKYASKITAATVYSAVRKTAIQTVVSKLINIMFKNIEIFLSIGGLIAGILDYATDRSLNGLIVVRLNTGKAGGR